MDYKQLLDFSNAYAVSIIEAMEKMGLDVALLGYQISLTLNKEASDLLAETGLKIKGNDVKLMTESFVSSLKEVGACQIAEIKSMDDKNMEIHLGECILAPARFHILNSHPDIIPPCPMMALLVGQLEKQLGKHVFIDSCEWKQQLNTGIFKVRME
ncbi:MAG: hypothetical protein K9W44_16545 [Candidatus Lokiarchaeota archaeon]|nr:hypothetical protein [Candidatus Harpocratesius repetitus]